MKKLALVLGMTLAIVNGMAQAATQEHDMSQHQIPMQMASSAAGHEGIGILKEVNAKSGKVLIAHEAIADLSWPPMTMWFTLRISLPQNIKVGDSVRFELEQTQGNHWDISRIERK
jgi:Cu/Ag efflux protein CusF